MNQEHASKEDFELEKGYLPLKGRTLEEVIIDGESDDEKKQAKDYVTLNNEPQWIASGMVNLKRKHKNVPNVSAVERLVAELGIIIIRDRYGQRIKEIERLRKKVYESGDQVFLMKSYRASDYQLQETVSSTYRRCSVREWTKDVVVPSQPARGGFGVGTRLAATGRGKSCARSAMSLAPTTIP